MEIELYAARSLEPRVENDPVQPVFVRFVARQIVPEHSRIGVIPPILDHFDITNGNERAVVTILFNATRIFVEGGIVSVVGSRPISISSRASRYESEREQESHRAHGVSWRRMERSKHRLLVSIYLPPLSSNLSPR